MPAVPAASPAHFNGALAVTQGSASAAITLVEKFHAAAMAAQPNATLSLAGREKFSDYLSLAAPANLALIYGTGMVPVHPGRAVIGDAAQGGLLALADQPTYGLASSDAALFDVQIMESI